MTTASQIRGAARRSGEFLARNPGRGFLGASGIALLIAGLAVAVDRGESATMLFVGAFLLVLAFAVDRIREIVFTFGDLKLQLALMQGAANAAADEVAEIKAELDASENVPPEAKEKIARAANAVDYLVRFSVDPSSARAFYRPPRPELFRADVIRRGNGIQLVLSAADRFETGGRVRCTVTTPSRKQHTSETELEPGPVEFLGRQWVGVHATRNWPRDFNTDVDEPGQHRVLWEYEAPVIRYSRGVAFPASSARFDDVASTTFIV